MKLLILLALLLGGHGYAQQKPGGAKAYLSILALGEVAESQYRETTAAEKTQLSQMSLDLQERGGSLYKDFKLDDKGVLMPPAATAVPPASLIFSTEERDDPKAEDQKSKGPGGNRIIVGFNKILPPVAIPCGKPIGFSKQGETSEYISLPGIKKPAQFLMLLVPGDDGDSAWESARVSKVLEVSAGRLANGSVFIMNYSSEAVLFSLGDPDEAVPAQLNPGKSMVLTASGKGKAAIFVGYDRRNQIVSRRSVRPRKDSIDIFAFHNANPATNMGRKLGVAQGTLMRVKLNGLSTP